MWSRSCNVFMSCESPGRNLVRLLANPNKDLISVTSVGSTRWQTALTFSASALIPFVDTKCLRNLTDCWCSTHFAAFKVMLRSTLWSRASCSSFVQPNTIMSSCRHAWLCRPSSALSISLWKNSGALENCQMASGKWCTSGTRAPVELANNRNLCRAC